MEKEEIIISYHAESIVKDSFLKVDPKADTALIPFSSAWSYYMLS